jgi:hypothetical protein
LNGYLLSIAGVVILSAILSSILPIGKTSGLIKLVMRMACILAIISPIITFFYTGSLSLSGVKKSDVIFSQSVIEQERAFIHYHSEMRISETEKALEKEIFEQFSVESDVVLSWEFEADYDVIKITKIHVVLIEQKEGEVLKKMWEYLTKNYCSEVLIE